MSLTPEQKARRDHLRTIGSKGGQARAAVLAARRAPLVPYDGDFPTFLEATGRGGPSRAVWAVFWKAADGLPLTPDELLIFQRHTGRTVPLAGRARECWVPAGRRGGKSEQMVTRATWRAISQDWRGRLTRGEVGVIPLIASDRDQARNSLRYLKGLAELPLVKPYVGRILRDEVEFRTGASVRVATASWRSTRGYTMLDVILEECAFYQVEGSAVPDEEILNAVRPALLTVPDARVYGISSAYAKRGILWQAYEKHWARDDSDVLVFSADTLSLNPTVDAATIARAFEDDPARAGAEYGMDGLVQFRADVEALFSVDALRACVVQGRRELPPLANVVYTAFCDMSGGSHDSAALAIAHKEKGQAVLDLVREVRAPHSPETVVAAFVADCHHYNVRTMHGDRYSAEWSANAYERAGLTYKPSEKTKSELYVELLPAVNAGLVALLDWPNLVAQFAGLERKTSRGTGRDVVDHRPGARDDLCNAAAGALTLATAKKDIPAVRPFSITGPSYWAEAHGDYVAHPGDLEHRWRRDR